MLRAPVFDNATLMPFTAARFSVTMKLAGPRPTTGIP